MKREKTEKRIKGHIQRLLNSYAEDTGLTFEEVMTSINGLYTFFHLSEEEKAEITEWTKKQLDLVLT